MENPFLQFHHFGLAIRRPDEAQKFLRSLGYEIGEVIFDPKQNVRLAMCYHPTHPAVEIIMPGEGSGPIDVYVQRHQAGIIYHLCYQTPSLADALAALEQGGARVICVSPPQPAVLFGGRKVSFYNVVGMGLIEILEPPSAES
jgi:methylmalonyl-CoA/ethylmalonyl-CoA epimerase